MVIGGLTAARVPTGGDTLKGGGVLITGGSNDLIAGDTITTAGDSAISIDDPSIEDTRIIADTFTSSPASFNGGVVVEEGNGIQIGDSELGAPPNEFKGWEEPIYVSAGATAFVYNDVGVALDTEAPFDTISGMTVEAPTISSATDSGISGSGAPGATVEVIDAGAGPEGTVGRFDAVVGTSVVEPDGQWLVVPASTPAGAYVTALQSVSGDGSSQPAAAVHLIAGAPPTALAFSVPSEANPAGGTRPARPGHQLAFEATATAPKGSSISSYTWNFGDGTSPVTGASVKHEFKAAGAYQVTLSVRAANGSAAQLTHGVQIAGDAPPVAGVSEIQSTYTEGESAPFNTTASSDPDGEIVKWVEKRDTTTIAEASIPASAPTTITFPAAGGHKVTLTVTDDEGLSTSRTYDVNVQAVPPPPLGPGETSLNKLVFENLEQLPVQTFSPSSSQSITSGGQQVLPRAPAPDPARCTPVVRPAARHTRLPPLRSRNA